MTFKADILRAFIGVMATLLKLSNISDLSPFVCGLPLGAISLALFWASVQRDPNSEMAGQVIQENDSSESLAAPSWSWANGHHWRKGIVYPPLLGERVRTYHLKLMGIEVFDQEATAAFSTMDSRPKGMKLEWTEKQNWYTLPLDIYAVLRIKAYTAPWLPEFTLQDIKYSTYYVWKATISLRIGTRKNLAIMECGITDIASKDFAEKGSNGLYLLQLCKASVTVTDKRFIERGCWSTVVEVLIVRRGKFW